MNMIATNVRFSVDEYKELRLLAFARNQSTAFLIRQAVSLYKNQKTSTKLQISLAERLKKVSVKINIPVLELVREGRRFE